MAALRSCLASASSPSASVEQPQVASSTPSPVRVAARHEYLQRSGEDADKKVTADPKDEAAWAELTKAQVQQASIIGYDQNTQSYNAAGKTELAKGAASWQSYLALEPKKPDDRVASLMVNAYGPGGLNEPVKAAAALKVVIEGRGASAALYSQLAVLAYLAGDKRESKIAEQRALELTPADRRKLVAAQLATQRTQIDSAQAQAAQQQSQGAPGLGG